MNHTMPKISVIVPVYNVEKYVQRCIDSILNQSFTDFEIIIINDASPDCSIEIIKKYYGNNPKVRIQENEQNLGLGPTRNYGIKVAYGKYIAFIDSDDYIEFDFLKILYETAERENADIVSCGYKTVNDSGIIRNYHDIPMVLNGGIGALDRLMTIHPMMPVWMRLYKRSLLQKNNLLFSPILAEDILFNFTAIYYCNKFITIPNELYCYFQSPESITRGKYNIKYLDTFFDILGYIEAFLQEVERKDMALNDAMKMRIYSYFFITYFAETFSDSFLQDESAKKILEEKLQQYFPQGHRYILFFIYHLKETRSMLNQYYQRVRILETETPILVQANRRRELASMLVRMNQEDWEAFVESNIYTAYWEFLYKISWKETTLGQDQRVYHELQQYLSEKRELWQLHCIYFASLLYEKPWNVPFLPQLRQLPNLLVQQYLQYVGHIAADQADCRQSQYIEFNAKLSEMILLALVTK